MEASYGWKCQQEKGITDERELMQHLQENSVAGRRGAFRKMPVSTPTSAQKASKKQGMQRDKQQHSKQRCIW